MGRTMAIASTAHARSASTLKPCVREDIVLRAVMGVTSMFSAASARQIGPCVRGVIATSIALDVISIPNARSANALKFCASKDIVPRVVRGPGVRCTTSSKSSSLMKLDLLCKIATVSPSLQIVWLRRAASPQRG